MAQPALAAAASPPRPGGLRRFLTRRRVLLFCYIALAPVLALFLYVRIIPIGFGVWLSFHKWNMLSPAKPFIGLLNYELLMQDENFHLTRLIHGMAGIR